MVPVDFFSFLLCIQVKITLSSIFTFMYLIKNSSFFTEQMGAGSSAIAAAASQALAATHYNVPGRRSSSLKAGLEKTRALKKNQPSGFFWVSLFFFIYLPGRESF
jgi:hypothetical protein